MIENKKLDPEHQAIQDQIKKLHEKIKELNGEIQNNQVQHQALFKQKASAKYSKEDNTANIKAQEERISKARSESIINAEIKETQEKIANLSIQYWETPFILEPMRLKTNTYWTDGYNTIRYSEDPENKKLYLYSGSNYATPSMYIYTDGNGVPKSLIRRWCNSDSLGCIVKEIQEIEIVDEIVKKDEPKPVTPSAIFPDVKFKSQEAKKEKSKEVPKEEVAEPVTNSPSKVSISSKDSKGNSFVKKFWGITK